MLLYYFFEVPGLLPQRGGSIWEDLALIDQSESVIWLPDPSVGTGRGVDVGYWRQIEVIGAKLHKLSVIGAKLEVIRLQI